MKLRVLRALMLALAVAFVLAFGASAQNILSACRLDAQSDYMDILGERAEKRPIVVIGPKGGRIEARIGCSWTQERWRLDPFKGGQMEIPIRWDALDGRHEPVPNTRSDNLFIPVKPGENVVPITFRRLALQYGNRSYPEFSATQNVTFDAWVFETEVVGRLESPVGAFTQQMSVDLQFVDARGNLYILYTRHQPRGQTTVLTRHNPQGRITARYEIGPNGEGIGASTGARMLVGVDTDGNAYGVVNGNFVQFDNRGRFVRAIAAFANRKLAESVSDLADQMGSFSQERDGPLADLTGLYIWPGFAPLFADGGFHVFAMAAAEPGATAGSLPIRFGRLGLDGSFTALGQVGSSFTFTPHGPVPGPGNRLYTTFSAGNDGRGLLIQDRDGRVAKRAVGPSFTMFAGGAIAGFDNDDGVYYAHGDGCERVKFSDMVAYAGGKVEDLRSTGGTVMNSRMLNQRWEHGTSGRDLIKDILTGQPVPSKSENDMPRRRACWAHGGSMYALWDDMTIGRFTFATAKGGTTTAAAAAGPTLRIEPTPATESGIVLDGRTKAALAVLLRDANNRPMPGVVVEIEIDDSDLGGDRGTLEIVDRVTDNEGRVRATYLPPAVDTSRLTTLRFIPIGLAASAQPEGQQPLEASATLRGLPTSVAQLQARHVGFEPAAAIPLPYRPDQDIVVQGRIVAKPKAEGFDSRFADALGKEYAAAGATIEILGEDGKPIGTGKSDHEGAFQVTIRGKGATAGKAAGEPIVLPEPIVLEDFTEPVSARIRRVGDILRVLEGSPYGYDTESLGRLLAETFPLRLAAARDDAAANREIDALERVGLFGASVKVTQDLGQHALEQAVDSLTSIVSGLFDVISDGDLLDKLKSKDAGAVGAEGVGRWALDRERAKLADLSPSQVLALSMFTKLRVYILQKLLAVLSREEGREAVQTFYEVTVWAVAKDAVTDLFSDASQWASDASGWKPKLSRPFNRHFHTYAQRGLGRIARAWADNTLSGRESLGPAMRALYADLAASKDRVSQKQLNYELYKANVDLGFATFGNSAKILSGIMSSPAGAKAVGAGVDGIEKAYKLLNVGIDAYLGFQWLADFEAGIAMLGELEQLAIGGGT